MTLSRLAVIQALFSHGIITYAQYMNFMYMKSVMSPFKRENEGSVIVEVGSEHCHSDGHITDTEEGEIREERIESDDAEAEINVLKECLVRQVPYRTVPYRKIGGVGLCGTYATVLRIRNQPNPDPSPVCRYGNWVRYGTYGTFFSKRTDI